MEVKKIPFESTWEIRHKVMWPDRTIDYVKLPNDKNGIHFGLFVTGRMVSIVSVFITGQEAQFRKFATLQEEQGKGYGTVLLSFIMQDLTSRNITRIWCNARINRSRFYEKFGLVKTDTSFMKGGIEYVIMEKNCSNTELPKK